MICMWGKGNILLLLDEASIFDKQARVLTPSMFMAHEPQMPSLQERRNVRVVSCSFLILIRASRTIGPHSVKFTE